MATNREAATFDDAAWKQMELPQYIEKAGLNIDGVIWFRKNVDLPAGAGGKKATISIGPVDDTDVTYVNGVKVGSIEKKYNEKRTYDIPAGVLKAGKNSITVRVEDTGGGGGIYGKPEEMFLQAGGKKISLSGKWNYEVEKEYGGGNKSLFKDVPLAEVFVDTYLNKTETTNTGATESGALATNGSTQVIKIKVIKNEMKYDLKTFTVEAGKPVELVFENPDFMQHNLVIAQLGALETVGKAADKLAANPKGAEMNYVPNIPEVLFSTKLVNPQQTVKLNFIAPKKEGDYPYICTFPGHWSIMNGTMKVVSSKSPL
jgi:azurin